MSKRVIIPDNERYGMLVFQKFDPKSPYPKRKLLCKCDCGNFCYTCHIDLKTGHAKSCGCNRHLTGKSHPVWRGYEEISMTFFSKILFGAQKRNLEFSITIEYLWELYLKQNKKCALTNLSLVFGNPKTQKYNPKSCSASLDRIDNTKGYIAGNVRWVHKIVNMMKNELPDNILIYLAHLIADNNIKPNIDNLDSFMFKRGSTKEKVYNINANL